MNVGLPRRHFGTASSSTTTDIIRTRDAYNTTLLDSNDVAGASTVKEVITRQDLLTTKSTDNESAITSLLSRVSNLENSPSVEIGTAEEFAEALDIASN